MPKPHKPRYCTRFLRMGEFERRDAPAKEQAHG